MREAPAVVHIKYVGQHEVEVPALGVSVEPNQVIEVEDPEGFIHQKNVWQVVKTGKETGK